MIRAPITTRALYSELPDSVPYPGNKPTQILPTGVAHLTSPNDFSDPYSSRTAFQTLQNSTDSPGCRGSCMEYLH